MSAFEFIRNEKLREILQKDFNELRLCQEIDASKAIMILSGSIIEGVLLDYLRRRRTKAENLYRKKHGKSRKLEELYLSDLIDIGAELKVLSSGIKEMSQIIQDHRNLIHPGKVLRKKIKIDRDRAEVVANLTKIILRDIEEASVREKGYNAGQLFRKIIKDANVDSVLEHILDTLSEREKDKLFRLISDKYFSAIEPFSFPDDIRIGNSFKKCFNLLRGSRKENIRKENMRKIIGLIRGEEQEEITRYFDVFFDAEDLKLMSEKEQNLIIDYFLGWLKRVFHNFEEERKVLSPLAKFSTYVPSARRGKYFDFMIELYLDRLPQYTNYKIPREILLTAAQSGMFSNIKKIIEEKKEEYNLETFPDKITKLDVLSKDLEEALIPF